MIRSTEIFLTSLCPEKILIKVKKGFTLVTPQLISLSLLKELLEVFLLPLQAPTR